MDFCEGRYRRRHQRRWRMLRLSLDRAPRTRTEWIKREIVGEDARNIENIWQTIFHTFDDLNGRGYVSHLISAIDIALWDIKGKALGTPVYQLLGGPVRERVPLYTHVQDWNSEAGGPEDAAKAAIATKEAGYEAIKTDPFPTQTGPNAGFSGPCRSGTTNAREYPQVGRMDGCYSRRGRSGLRVDG